MSLFFLFKQPFGEVTCRGPPVAYRAKRWALVLASGGYPGPHPVDLPITGVAEAAAKPGVEVFHAGTARRGDELVTAGGRVLSVSALDQTFAAARRRAYAAADLISFEGAARRGDIALRAELGESPRP